MRSVTLSATNQSLEASGAATEPDGGDKTTARSWRSVVREPLLHFLLVGAVLFSGYQWLAPKPDQAIDTQRIVLTEDDVAQLVVSWLAQGRNPPTPEQIRALIDQKITQEILFREAVALGLDRDDEVVKRRLAQKMDFLAADLASLQETTADELKAWFDLNASALALPARATFTHLYFSPDKHGKATREAASAALLKVSTQSPASTAINTVGDAFMFQNHYGGATPARIAKEFGTTFSDALFQLAPGQWHGPVQSGYGWHLVWMDAVEPGRIPAFEEVAPQVKQAWMEERYREIKRAALTEMRSRYVVTLPEINSVKDLRGLAAGLAPDE